MQSDKSIPLHQLKADLPFLARGCRQSGFDHTLLSAFDRTQNSTFESYTTPDAARLDAGAGMWQEDLWKDFIRSHPDTLAAVDVFTAEVWTASGLMIYYVLVFMRIVPRQVCIAGFTPSPDVSWTEQMARNMTMAGEGILNGCRYLLHDRDAKFSAAFDGLLRSAGIKPMVLPPRSPNLNAHLERWNRSVKEECLSKMILFGEASLRHVLSNYAHHFHNERNHQGKANVILFPAPADRIGESSGEIRTCERLVGLLKFYHREAA